MKIQIEKLYKSFNGHEVLKGVNLDIEEGQTTVIIGGSGCGKSVLLKHIIGLLKPDAGKIYIAGCEITSLRESKLESVRRQFGMVFQSSALLNSLTIRENVGLALKERKQCPDEKIDKIVREKLDLVNLRGVEDQLPAELSGGMRKRVAIARALVGSPRILLFDEPTAELDPPMARVVTGHMLDLKKRLKITSVVVTHDMANAYTIGDKIGMLHEGRIIQIGSPEEIMNSKNEIVRDFVARDQI